jgi:hypothetical protein
MRRRRSVNVGLLLSTYAVAATQAHSLCSARKSDGPEFFAHPLTPLSPRVGIRDANRPERCFLLLDDHTEYGDLKLEALEFSLGPGFRHFQDRKLVLLIKHAEENLQAASIADSSHTNPLPVPWVPGIAHFSRLSFMGIWSLGCTTRAAHTSAWVQVIPESSAGIPAAEILGHQIPRASRVLARPVLSGLHHEYRLEKVAA